MNGVTDRLFAMVDLLRVQQHFTTQALAEHFNVSARTIRRDLTRLQALEVEVNILPGRGGGVTLAKGSTMLPALRFTDDEALVLALGLKQADRTTDPRLAKAARSAFKRLKHVLSESLGERIDSVLQVLESKSAQDLRLDNIQSHTLLDLSQAVQHHERLEVRYRSQASGFTYRMIDPYGIVYLHNHWYLAGYCHLRKDTRTFRLDRLELLKSTGKTFKAPKNFDAFKTISASLALAQFPGSVLCRIWLQTDLTRASQYVPGYAAVLEPRDDGVILTLRVDPAWLFQVAVSLLEFPFSIQILEPEGLNETLGSLAKRLQMLSAGHLA